MDDCTCLGAIGIAWFLCALGAASIYRSKGRSEAAAFLLGLFLGPVAVVLAAVTPKDEGALERKALDSGKIRKCPHCAELVKRDARVCRYCGRDLVDTGV